MEFPFTFAVLKKGKIAHRGMVERFIAPVLKTGEPLRVPGVRIPPPLQYNESKSPDYIGVFFASFCKGDR